jgi:16S rRNA (guanine966-N2)-methyltransferase
MIGRAMPTRDSKPHAAKGRRSRGSAAAPARRRPGGTNTVRIVGGEWRGRRLSFPDVAGLRPTPDPVRETLFNWLMPVIRGARCLDLFAGSGVLGFEALSRGAAAAVLVERAALAAGALRETARVLGAGDRAAIHAQPAQVYLAAAVGPFDVVFLDPPFDAQALPAAFGALVRPGLLASDAMVYAETRSGEPLPPLPAGWRIHRSGRAGEVGYHLLACSASGGGGLAAEPPDV